MPKLVPQATLDIKYRPKTFADVIGQDHVIKILTGMLKSEKIDRSIMLYGPSGSGKTTIGRLIARYINCTGDEFLCGKCMTCTTPLENHPDICELNAAFATGIDDVRGLREFAQYMPETNFKVFIIDEAQQISGAGKSCLLKDLEEASQGNDSVVWIVCTTEPEKFDSAFLGRCLKLPVKPVSIQDLAKLLYKVAVLEKSPIAQDKKSLIEIAKLVRGQPRDGLKTLGKVMHYLAGADTKETPITADALMQIVKEVVDTPPDVLISKYLLSVYLGKYTSAFASLQETQNAEYFLRSLIDFHTNVLYHQVKSTLMGQYLPYARLVEAVAQNKAELPTGVMSTMLTTMVQTLSEVKRYLIPANTLMISMTCTLVTLVESAKTITARSSK